MPFQKGKSGNPGGRPKLAEDVKKLAQASGKEAILRLIELMRDEDKRVAIAASTALLDRGFGKAPQAIEHTGDIEMTNFVLYGIPEAESIDEWQQQHTQAIQ